MRKLRWVPLAVLLLGAAEFFVLIGVAKLTGVPIAVLGLLALSLLGLLLVRREGVRGWRRLREARRAGGPAGDDALYALAGLVASILLLVPGYLTGIFGLILLVPPIRKLVRNRMRTATERRVPASAANEMFGPRQVKVTTTKNPPKSATTSEDVIEGEIVD